MATSEILVVDRHIGTFARTHSHILYSIPVRHLYEFSRLINIFIAHSTREVLRLCSSMLKRETSVGIRTIIMQSRMHVEGVANE